MNCYLGFCTGPHSHNRLHFEKTGHSIFLRIHRRRLPMSPQPVTKLGINVPGGYQDVDPPRETSTSLFCIQCNTVYPCPDSVPVIIPFHVVGTPRGPHSPHHFWREEGGSPVMGRVIEVMSPLSRVPSSRPLSSRRLFAFLPIFTQSHSLCRLRSRSQSVALLGMRQIPLRSRPVICGRSSRYVSWSSITSSHGHAFRHFQETGHSLAVRVASLTEVPFWREFHLGQCRHPLLSLR